MLDCFLPCEFITPPPWFNYPGKPSATEVWWKEMTEVRGDRDSKLPLVLVNFFSTKSELWIWEAELSGSLQSKTHIKSLFCLISIQWSRGGLGLLMFSSFVYSCVSDAACPLEEDYMRTFVLCEILWSFQQMDGSVSNMFLFFLFFLLNGRIYLYCYLWSKVTPNLINIMKFAGTGIKVIFK